MQYNNIINLDEHFEPFGPGINAKQIVFSGGELHVELPPIPPGHVLITTRITHSEHLMELLLVTDVVKRLQGRGDEIHVFIPYIPYARQDRVTSFLEPLSIKVFADIINAQGYDRVMMLDPHSDVTPALINNSHVIKPYRLINEIVNERKDYVLVAPDAGAYKKIFEVASFLRIEDIVQCTKYRDTSTGQILKIDCDFPEDRVHNRNCLIIDDICDGGGTFRGIAETLKVFGASSVDLFVTHGIFKNGIGIENIDKIVTTDSFKTFPEEEKPPLFKQINIREIHLIS